MEIRTAISLCIPGSFRSLSIEEIAGKLRGGAVMEYAMHQQFRNGQDEPETRRWPARGFLSGDVHDLVPLLTTAALPKEYVEQVADKVAGYVKNAAYVLAKNLQSDVRKRISRAVRQRSSKAGLQVSMVLWLNALLTQQRLYSQQVSESQSLPFADPIPPSMQIRIWEGIRDRNWRSIFDPALQSLRVAVNSDPGVVAQALTLLVQGAEEIEMAHLGAYINVGAELFPKLSEDRKEAAAFYTQPATAELLAGLTIRESSLQPNDWRDDSLFGKRSIADLACGTGTLLRAGYKRVLSLHAKAGGNARSVRSLHRDAMQTGLIGADISPIAAHLTSSSLAALGKGEAYDRTRIGWLEIGGPRDLIGSLEFIASSKVSDMFASGLAGKSDGKRKSGKSIQVENGDVDWILMNPPYSRTRGGQSVFDVAGLSDAKRAACQQRWQRITRGEPVNNQAGLAASFLALARLKVRPGGHVGFVLPLTAAHAQSWAVTRRMIEFEFENVIAITVAGGQALGRDALSADTHMEEMLLVCRRRDNGEVARNDRSVYCVTLNQPVARVGEASEIARLILNEFEAIRSSRERTFSPIMAGAEQIGHVYRFAAQCRGDPWSPLGAVHGDLAAAADSLTKGILQFSGYCGKFNVEMATLDRIFGVGPTHDRIGCMRAETASLRGAFEFVEVAGRAAAASSDTALWAANARLQRQMIVLPTHRGYPRDGVEKHQFASIRSSQSDLHYARNMRWTSQALLAAMTETPAMGGRAWTSLQHRDERVRKAFALWANSTFGMLVHWTQGQRTQSGRSTTQIQALKQVPCPMLDRLDDAGLAAAAGFFDRHAKVNLLPACQAHRDKARARMDNAVIEMLNLPDGAIAAVDKLRILWCNEPSVHGRARNALSLLDEGG